MTTTVEAWSIPTAGTMVKKDFAVPFSRLQVELVNSEPTQGVITVDRSTKDRIIDSSNNETSLIRVFKDGHNCQSFIARSVQYAYGAKDAVHIAGPTLHEELNNAVILPQNYPEPEDPDFEYQSINVLENGDAEGSEGTWAGDGFEDGITAGDAWSAVTGGEDWDEPTSFGVNSVWARTGTYSMRMNPGGPQSAIKRSVNCMPNTVVWIWSYVATPDAPDVGTRLATGVTIEEGGGYLANSIYKQYYLEDGLLVAEVNNEPQGTGTTPDTDFHPIGMKFLTGPEQTSFDFYFIHFGLSTVQHANIDDIEVISAGVGTEPWYAWAGVEFSRQDSVVYEGDYAFQFQVVDYTLSEHAQGIGQLVSTGPNLDRLFTFQGRARNASGTPRSVIAVLKKASGPWYKSKTFTVTNSGWTEFTVSAVITEEEFYVELRDNQTHYPGGSNGPIIYADAMVGYWGLGEAPTGAILQDLLAPIQARGVLTWLKTDSFDETTDSNGVPWPQDEEIVIWHGMTFLQVLDTFKNRGYEWDIVWNNSAEMYELLVYYPYTMGGDLTATGLKFHTINLRQGTIVEADPGANNFYGEGDDGIYASVVNATLEAGYGPREMWIDDRASLTEAALVRRLGKASIDAVAAQFSLVANVGSWFTPGLTAGPGALVKIQMSGEVAEREDRIARMIYTVTDDGVESTTINFGAEYYGPYAPPGEPKAAFL